MLDVSANIIAAENNEKLYSADIYHFYVDSSHFYYTSADHEIVYGGNTYSPISIRRGSVTYESTIKAAILNLDVSNINIIASGIISLYLPALVFCDVCKIYLDMFPYEARTIFSGVILDVSLKGAAGSIKVASYDYLLSGPIPIWRFQRQCNHMLFDNNCLLNSADYAVNASAVVAVNGRSLECETAAGYEDNYFTYGYIEWNGNKRRIVSHAGNAIVVAIGVYGMVGEVALTLYPGCDGLNVTCRDKFDNIDNFLGTPDIPMDNPVIWV